MLPTTLQKKQKPMHWQVFLLGILTAAAFFIPYCILGQGYFLFYGDFNVQQVPFYQLCHEAVRSGEIGWNWGTDLGVNFIGSYTFYLLGSPFFWLTLPFPNSFVPYLMGPLLILKFGLASLTAYFYLRRFVRNPESAVLGGILYAFSGFSVYNIFFNHFHEAIVIFPLLLLSMEMHIVDRRRGPFGAMVFISALTNYFFFFGMVVFCVIYWVIRVSHRCWKQSLKSFFLMAFEAVLGLLMSMVLLLPTIFAVLQNDRLSSVNLGYNSWLYGRVQIYANILEIFFFPPDIPARPVFFPDADIKWSSMGAWLPLFSMVGVFAFAGAKKKNWISRILKICLVMALVPILNSAFYMFNSAYYARWFYMPILIMCLATVMAVEDNNISWKPAFKWVTAITVVTTLIVGLWPAGKNDDGSISHFGIYTFEEDSYTYIVRFWVTCAIALISLLILGILLHKYRKYHSIFIRNSLAAVCVISVIYSAVFIGCGKSHSYDINDEVIPDLIEGKVELEGDPDTFRIDCYECMDNTAMFLGYSSINAFHSIVPGSVMEFYEYVGEERSVASRPETDNYAIRSLLSVKYLLSRVGGDSFVDDDGETLMPYWQFVKQENDLNVYENECYIPYGFTYDSYISKEKCDTISEDQRAEMLVKAILLDEKQIEKYAKRLGLENIDEVGYFLDGLDFLEDTKARSETAAYEFVREKNGFSSKIKLEKENLVFFSVPYEEGWTAYVNGSPVEIEKVNIGFMAVLAPAGDVEIEFRYSTPGLMLGLVISLSAALMFGLYLLIVKKYRRTHPVKYMGEWPEGEELYEYWENNPEPQPPVKAPESEEEDSGLDLEEYHPDDTVIDLEALHKFIDEPKEQ